MTQPIVPLGAAVTTPEQMLAAINALREQQHDQNMVTNTKIDNLASVIDPAFNDIRQQIVDAESVAKDHEARLRILEQWRWKAAGVFLAVEFASSAIIAYVTTH